MKPRDVVIRLRHQQRHGVFFADFARLLVILQRPREIIQANQTRRHITQHDSHTLGVLMRLKRAFIRFFVMCNCLDKAILAVKNVAEIDIETRQPLAWKIEAGENFPRALGCQKGAVIFTE